MSPMSRREFLLAGAGLALAAACGGGDGEGGSAAAPSTSGKPKAFNLVIASFVHVAAMDERVTVAFLNADASGPLPIDGPVELSIDGKQVEAEVHTDGVPLPYLLVRHRFGAPGVVMVEATYKGDTGTAPLQVVDRSAAKLPIQGTPMLSVPSPTAADALGVDPICTREPACPLHDVSLDAALAEKRPTAVLFSTPARCQSRLCGPVLDTVLEQREAYGDRVRFVHVEIYAARSGNALSPTVKAYNLAAEPILYLAGADGVVRERLDNAFDRVELKAALDRLVAG